LKNANETAETDGDKVDLVMAAIGHKDTQIESVVRQQIRILSLNIQWYFIKTGKTRNHTIV
jgi:hypothetical protein